MQQDLAGACSAIKKLVKAMGHAMTAQSALGEYFTKLSDSSRLKVGGTTSYLLIWFMY